MARPRLREAPWGEERAPYACRFEESRGRRHDEPASTTRTPFQRDRDRIIHASAFRRLKQKTQVFVAHEGDHYRTRLTHSLEVAQIARSIARVLGLDEDLCEALALAHDLGHPPFGHAGEDALSQAMAPFGGFDHNAHALKLVTALEQRYPGFDGLNLTWETLEGMVKHNGPPAPPLPRYIADYAALHDLALTSHASLEAQVAAISDDIAYNNHDIDDGWRAGLFTFDDLAAVPFAGDELRAVLDAFPGLEPSRVMHETVRRLIGRMIADVIAETLSRIGASGIGTVADVRAAGVTLSAFSPALQAHDRALKAFLFERMYRHYRVNRMVAKAKRVVHDLFGLFLAQPNVLPPEWGRLCGAPDSAGTAGVVADYIAGMTDRFALEEHRRLFAVESGY